MTKGTNKSIYKFRVHNKTEQKTDYYFTGLDLCEEMGFPRSSLYYILKNKEGKMGDYFFERIYIPKKMLNRSG